MAFIDLRSQLVRFTEEGSTYVNPQNPSPQTLIQKPFEFDYNKITNRSTDLERFFKFLGTRGGKRFETNFALLQQVQQELNQKVAASAKPGGTLVGNILRTAGTRALGTFLGNVGFTANIAKQIPVMGSGIHFVNNTSGRFYIDSTAGSNKVVKDLLKGFLRNVGITGQGEGGPLPVFDPEGQGRVSSILADKESKYRDDFDGPLSGVEKTAAKFNLPLDTSKIREAITGTNELTGTNVGFAADPSDLGRLKDKYESVKGVLVDKAIEFRSRDTANNTFVTPLGKAVKVKNALSSKFGAKNNTISNTDYFTSTTLDTSLEDENELQELFEKQFIPFSFHTLTPDKSTTLFFNAFLDSFGDSYSGTWNGTQYIGRGEQFYTYQGFTRDINFSFKVAAFNKNEVKKMYRKLNLLAGSTAPSYSEKGNFMRGTLTRVNIGDLLYRQNGFINSVDLSWNTTYPWEKDYTQLDSPLKRVPHVLDVSVKFTPIHDFNVKSDLDIDGGEAYFGGNLTRKGKEPVSVITARGLISTPSALPTAEVPNIPRATTQTSNSRGFVEVGQGDFGGPFDNGGFVDLDSLTDEDFAI